MTRFPIRFTTLAAVLSATAFFAAAFETPLACAQTSDQVFGSKGAPARGEIIRMSKSEIVLKTRSIERSYQVNEVKKVTFKGEPKELSRARDYVLTGRLEDAAEELKKLTAAKIERDYVKQDIAYYTAYCNGKISLSGGGDKAAAVTAMLDFIKSARDSYHFYEAVEVMGDLAVALDNYEKATLYYQQLGKAPWPDLQMRGAVLVARTLQSQGKFAEALQSYQKLAGSKIDTPEANRQKLFARIGAAACLAETGKAAEGVKIVEEIIAKNDPQDTQLFARCYNALGDCQRKVGKPKDALLAYLHTDLLFSADGETHAEALYRLSLLWGELKKSDRAVSARSLLRSRYSGSAWAKKEG